MSFLLTGCTTSRTTQYTKFVNAFLPNAPKVLVVETPPDLPSAHTSELYAQEKVTLLKPLEPNAISDASIQKADEHFASGKRLYEQGDASGARHEFNQAIEALLAVPSDVPDRPRVERKLEQLADAIYRYDIEGLGAGKSHDEIVYDKPPLDDILDMTFPVDPRLKPKVTGELTGTVSELPLELSDPVLSFIHYFSTERGHKILAGSLRRMGRYRPMVEKILQEEGVPKELIFLALEESGFLPHARSPKACVGMWQFAQFRGREYGLNQTAYADERMDPEKATRAAAQHLRDLNKHFGDWYLAMAAYDCGPGCVDRAVERTGYADFWELHRLNALPQETKNYVPLIVAMTIMAKNPKDYDLDGVEFDPPLEMDKLVLQAPASLALVSDVSGVSVTDLEELNPSLLRPVAPAGFELGVPKGTLKMVEAGIARVPAEHRLSWRLHRTEAGDTLASIARRYASSPAVIAGANSGVAGDLTPGALLVIPAAPVVAAKAPRSRPVKTRSGAPAKVRAAQSASRTSKAHADAKPAKGKTYVSASLHTPTRHHGEVSR
jgi:membrane-bound lytic murein transglycosylase D